MSPTRKTKEETQTEKFGTNTRGCIWLLWDQQKLYI